MGNVAWLALAIMAGAGFFCLLVTLAVFAIGARLADALWRAIKEHRL